MKLTTLVECKNLNGYNFLYKSIKYPIEFTHLPLRGMGDCVSLEQSRMNVAVKAANFFLTPCGLLLNLDKIKGQKFYKTFPSNVHFHDFALIIQYLSIYHV